MICYWVVVVVLCLFFGLFVCWCFLCFVFEGDGVGFLKLFYEFYLLFFRPFCARLFLPIVFSSF